MSPRKSWAAVWCEGAVEVPSPIPTAALARCGDVLLCSLVLPWRGAGRHWPATERVGEGFAAWTSLALERLRPAFAAHRGAIVLGGDLNHSLVGPERVGSRAGRTAIVDLLAELHLQCPTAESSHRVDGLGSIDHVAVPDSWGVEEVHHVGVEVAGRRLSDHDAYVVETIRTAA